MELDPISAEGVNKGKHDNPPQRPAGAMTQCLMNISIKLE
jgi:hypothetical protein